MEKEITYIDLYEIAKAKYNPRTISPFIEAGSVSAAILTEDNNVYTGVCIDTASTLGMCAERNAIANMITNGESKIKNWFVIVEKKKSVVLAVHVENI